MKLVETYLDNNFYKAIQGQTNVAIALTKQKWDMIMFTGSTFKGKLVAKAAAENLVPCVLELGGKCPVIVDESCDNIDFAARKLVTGKAMNAG